MLSDPDPEMNFSRKCGAVPDALEKSADRVRKSFASKAPAVDDVFINAKL